MTDDSHFLQILSKLRFQEKILHSIFSSAFRINSPISLNFYLELSQVSHQTDWSLDWDYLLRKWRVENLSTGRKFKITFDSESYYQTFKETFRTFNLERSACTYHEIHWCPLNGWILVFGTKVQRFSAQNFMFGSKNWEGSQSKQIITIFSTDSLSENFENGFDLCELGL